MTVEHDIQRVKVWEWGSYRDLRLQALTDAPYAFASSLEQALERPVSSWQAQVARSAIGSQYYTALLRMNGLPRGLGALYGVPQLPHRAELLQVWVDPALRHFGLGRQLVEHLQQWGYGEGYTEIIATVHVDNPQALTFYKHLGYSEDRAATDQTPPRDIVLRHNV